MKSTAAALILLCTLAIPALAETASHRCNPSQISDRCVQRRQEQFDRDVLGTPPPLPPATRRASPSDSSFIRWSDAPRLMPSLRR